MRRIPVGFMLHPNLEFHQLAVALIHAGVDFVEVAPETAWRHDGASKIAPNHFARLYVEAAAAFGLPIVAHGVALSPSTRDPLDEPRLREWIRTVGEHAPGYRWWTDHHGLTWAGEALALPMPPLPTEDVVHVTATRLAAMKQAVRSVGLETTASYAHWGDPMLEAVLQTRIASEADSGLLLDLHNVWTMAINGGFSAAAWIAHLDLSRVMEIHISGGSPSDPAWGGGMRAMWLDAHDAEVPAPVWSLLESVMPHCPNLRGVTLERMEGTATLADLPALRGELDRLAALCGRVEDLGAPAPLTRPLLPALVDETALRWERALGPCLRDAHPVQALRRAAHALPDLHRRAVVAADTDGIRLSAMLIAKLRLERVLNGTPDAEAALERDPRLFTARFTEYHRTTPSRSVFPWHEAAQFQAWARRQDASSA